MANKVNIVAVSHGCEIDYVVVPEETCRIGDTVKIDATAVTGVVVDVSGSESAEDVIRMVSRKDVIYYGIVHT